MKSVVVKVSETAFVGTDGKEVHGQYFYVKSVFGGPVTRIFLAADAILRLSVVPSVGDTVILVENGAGKVVDMLEDIDV